MLLQQISPLLLDLDTLYKEGQHLTAFKLLTTLRHTLLYGLPPESAVMKYINTTIRKKCLPALIHVVCSAPSIDTHFFYNLLQCAGDDYLNYVQHYMKMYRRQPKKLRDLSLVGVRCLTNHNEVQSKDVMLNAIVTCKWWKKLKMSQGKLQYEPFFKSSADQRLSQLITLNAINAEFIEEYCVDFKLVSDGFYKEYLRG